MIFKNIIEKLGFTWSKNVAGDVEASKVVGKRNTHNAPAIIAGGSVQASGDIVVGNQTVHNHLMKPKKTDAQLSHELINFLEDRRVLFGRFDWERPEDCVASVFEIRRYLTVLITEAKPAGALEAELKQMRAACRKFLDSPDGKHGYGGHHGASHGFRVALDTFRYEVGSQLESLTRRQSITLDNQLNDLVVGDSER